MRKRIIKNFCLMALITILLTGCLFCGVMYLEITQQMEQQVKNEANFIAMGLPDSDREDYLIRTGRVDPSTRVTLIAADGTVLFDDRAPAGEMTNHLDREEVAGALKFGAGQAKRFSDTIKNETYYYALRLEDGSVLRVASTQDSVFSTLFSVLPWLILVAAGVFLLAVFIARRQTVRIVVPINNIDIENPLSNQVYDELAPLLQRLEEQRVQIRKQISLLGQKQKEFDAITENMREGLVLLNDNGRILSINQSACRIFGISAHQALGCHMLAVDRSEALQDIYNQAIDGLAAGDMLTKGACYYQLQASPVFEHNAVKGVVILVFNITERYQAERQRREFTANVSHELKTPLTSIRGYGELILNGLVKAEDVRPFIQRIYDESNRLIAMVENILELSRLEEQAVEQTFQPVELAKVAEAVKRRLEAMAEKRRVQMKIELPKGANPVISGEPVLLEDLLYNLCDNAIKYNKEGGQVTIRLWEEGSQSLLSVTDTGIGIPEESQSRVFERFYRADQSHSRREEGNGLGLAIVKHIAQRHGGTIRLESREGMGTKITVSFPSLYPPM
ncbi:MAG: ATP-binding protein [Peptococcaceae bacterium]|nr:ATP-binding protein [Peptococcaceae bacterium]